jgi:hypothetical protein
MSTVQLAIRNQRYAAALADLLRKDDEHEVVFVDRPDLSVDGVMVVDGDRAENLLLFEQEPDRFVVITYKDANMLGRVWDAGVRHVVFQEDSPATALLAIIAAELRSPRPRNASIALCAQARPGPKHMASDFRLAVLQEPKLRHRCCFSDGCKPLL